MGGKRAFLLGLYSCVLVFSMLLASTTYAQTCASYKFSSNQVFSSCTDLPYLDSFLHWNYDTSTGKVQLAYRHTSVDTSRWVSWAINPTSSGMPGAQALVAYQLANGSMRAYTSPISGYQISSLDEGKLSFDVSDISATYSSSDEITIFATITPPGNSTTVSHVWQDGPLTSSGVPGQHALSGANGQSKGTLNFATGVAGSSGGNSRLRKKNVHGVLNVVSWGILMPIGVIIARYLRVFESADPAWFYLHVTCQSSAYIVGVAGWATGLKLGSESKGITFTVHRSIGIILFCLAPLQVFALLLRPRKDHKYRNYWNLYHRLVGFAVIILSIVNIFRGFNILNPEKKWKHAYIVILIALGVIFVLLEAFTWFIWLKRRKSSQQQESAQKVSYGYGNGNSNNNNSNNGFGYSTTNGGGLHHNV